MTEITFGEGAVRFTASVTHKKLGKKPWRWVVRHDPDDGSDVVKTPIAQGKTDGVAAALSELDAYVTTDLVPKLELASARALLRLKLRDMAALEASRNR